MNKLYGKLIINSKLILASGLHIGGGNNFAAIGAVDSVVVRNPVTFEPYIPGSSLKGKMRYLLARTYADDMPISKHNNDPSEVLRLFGSSEKNNILSSRLQFFDVYFNRDSKIKLSKADTDLYLTEIKYENVIDRGTAEANPRQIERVLPGSVFDFKLVYNIENENEIEEDIKNMVVMLSLLENDYLGGSGTRGYGRIIFEDITCAQKMYSEIGCSATDMFLKTWENR